LIKLARSFNNFYFNGYLQKDYKPLVCQTHQIGFITADVEAQLSHFQDVFGIHQDRIDLCPGISDHDEISLQLDSVLRLLREKNSFISLQGWRDETFDIRPRFSQPPLFKIERTAVGLLGLKNYCVNINGYVVGDDGSISVWLQKRAMTKKRHPGYFDTLVGGGLSSGYTVQETAIKEAEEEANMPKNLAEQMEPAGCVSFFFHFLGHGIEPSTSFVFDIKLPKDFVPTVNDGEVDEFVLVPASELIDAVCNETQFSKCSMPVMIDFLIRKGIINLENEPDLPELIELLHMPLHSLK